MIRDTDGKAYEISYWTSEEVSAKDENGQDTTKKVVYAVLTDGSKIQFDKGTITYTENGETKTATMEDYEVKGIKYVPVAVKTEDYADFCKKYSVTEDASAIEGGYTENALKAYTKTARSNCRYQWSESCDKKCRRNLFFCGKKDRKQFRYQK